MTSLVAASRSSFLGYGGGTSGVAGIRDGDGGGVFSGGSVSGSGSETALFDGFLRWHPFLGIVRPRLRGMTDNLHKRERSTNVSNGTVCCQFTVRWSRRPTRVFRAGLRVRAPGAAQTVLLRGAPRPREGWIRSFPAGPRSYMVGLRVYLYHCRNGYSFPPDSLEQLDAHERNTQNAICGSECY